MQIAGVYSSISQLYGKCLNYDIISFDIFDTALIRLVKSPEDVFEIVGKVINDISFKSHRLLAQTKAESIYGRNTNIEAIYASMVEIGYFNEDKANEVLKIEIETENQICIPRKGIRELIKRLSSEGKNIIFLSDMYIPKKYLEQILIDKGFNGYTNVIVSCDIGKNKIYGDAYKYLLSLYPRKRIIHIGDNIRTDYINAKKYGALSSLLVKRVGEDSINKLISAALEDKKSAYQWGFSVMSKIVYGFTKWLYGNLKVSSAKQVLFFSREGVFFKTVFQTLGYSQRYAPKLFYASRRSMLVALACVDKEFVSNYILKTRCSIGEVFRIFNISKQDRELICRQHNISKLSLFEDVSDYNQLMASIIRSGNGYINEQYVLVKDYVYQFNLSGKVAVVDIGWNGTMQFLLEKLLDNMGLDVHLTGYYLGEFDSTGLNYDIEKYGYLCSKDDKDSIVAVTNAAYILEQCFTPCMGTTIGYKRKDKVVPVMKKADQSQIISDVQKGILDAVGEISNYSEHITFMVDKKRLLDQLKNPDIFYAQLFGDIQWSDVESYRYIAKPKKILTYLLNPIKLILDLQRAGWKTAFMKRLFKIKFPYYKIYKLVKGSK